MKGNIGEGGPLCRKAKNRNVFPLKTSSLPGPLVPRSCYPRAPQPPSVLGGGGGRGGESGEDEEASFSKRTGEGGMESWTHAADEDAEVQPPLGRTSPVDYSSGPELSEWVEERAARGPQGLLSLGKKPPTVERWARKGYVPVPEECSPAPPCNTERRGGGWDSSTSGTGIPRYDAKRDRHTRGLIQSEPFRQHHKGQSYAAEAQKAQTRRQRPRSYTNPTYAVAARAGPRAAHRKPAAHVGEDSYSDASTPREDSASDRCSVPSSSSRRMRSHAPGMVYGGSAGKKALMGLRRAQGHRVSASKPPTDRLPELPPLPAPVPPPPPPPPTRLPPVPPPNQQHASRQSAIPPFSDTEADCESLGENPPDSGPQSARQAQKVVQMRAAYRTAPTQAKRRQTAVTAAATAAMSQARRKPTPRRMKKEITINNSTTNNNYSTVNNYPASSGGEETLREIASITARLSQLEYDKELLSGQLSEEKKARHALSERLSSEIQKKLRSTKAASSRDREASSLRDENERLRERVNRAESKLALQEGGVHEKKRLQASLQQREALYRELSDLYEKQEKRLASYEEGTVKDKAAVRQQINSDHYRDRLAQEQKSRQAAEKRLAAAVAESAKLRQERDHVVAGTKSPPPRPRMAAELAAVQAERDRLAGELRERDRLMQRERQAAHATLAEFKRREAQRRAEVQEVAASAEVRGEELQKKLRQVEQTAERKEREASERRIAAERAQAAVRDAQAKEVEAREHLQRLERSNTEQARNRSEFEQKQAALHSELSSAREALDQERERGSTTLKQREAAWERERSQLLREMGHARMREQELAAEATGHSEHVHRLQRQLAEARGESSDAAGLSERLKAAEAGREDAKRQLAEMETKCARMKDELSDLRQNSQKDSIIEKLTQRATAAERLTETLRNTNQQLMARLRQAEESHDPPQPLRLE
eukprot:Hpha_TRINITY_DN16122_c1_g2::TRINITY_DN16122_c1_g2_i1::g.7252::m.7252